MEKPVEPSKEDCCNSGCNPCVFDIYEKQLKMYKKFLNDGDYITNFSQENGIKQLEYTEFIIVKKHNICDNHCLIIFKNVSLDCGKVCWNAGDHFLFKYTSNLTVCTRAYTPFTRENELCDFAIIVKLYDKGLVSPYLYNLTVGSTTLWRGPYGHYDIKHAKFDRIVMIAQGTGITAFIDIISSILNDEDDITKVMLFYCCRTTETILFRDELYTYKSYWNFNYNIYLSSSNMCSKIRYQEPINNKKLSVDDLVVQAMPVSGNDQFLICGSQQFNESFKTTLERAMPLIKNIVLF